MCMGGSGAPYHPSLLTAGNEVFNKGEPQEGGAVLLDLGPQHRTNNTPSEKNIRPSITGRPVPLQLGSFVP